MVIVKSASTPLKPTLTLKMLAQSLTTASARPRIKTICPLKNQISLATSVNVTRPFVVHTRTGLTGVTVAPLVTEVFNLEPDVLNSQMMLQINVKTKSKLATKMNVQNGLHGKHGQHAMDNVLLMELYQREQDIAVGIKRMVAMKFVRTIPVVLHLDATNSKRKNVIQNHANLNAFGLNG